jgi:histone-lysine N-methyltransferase SETMAR
MFKKGDSIHSSSDLMENLKTKSCKIQSLKSMFHCIGLNGKFLHFRRDGPFLKRLVICDENWIFDDNVTRKRQWCRPWEAPKPTPNKNLHSKKLMICVWWDMEGIYELLGPNKIINSEVYCQQLDRVNERLKEKRPHLVNRKGVVFHQDNAHPHVSKMTQLKIKELNWEILDHPPYSPDLAPSDYHLFRLQNHLNNKKFERFEEVNDAILAYFESKPRSFYKT